jgi:hypothetical protein
MKTAALLILIVGLNASLFANAGLRCAVVHQPVSEFEQSLKTLVDVNLMKTHHDSSQVLTSEAIQASNAKVLENLDQLPKRQSYKALSLKDAESLIQQMTESPFVQNENRYSRKEVEMGYCFGRATFMHLHALKLGYKKEQIKKIWVVGPMEADNINWGYHVATIIRSPKGKWFVIDNEVGTPLTPKEWFAHFLPASTDGKLQVFVTEAEKLFPVAGKYSRFEMGLDMQRRQDYYRGYFKDLVKGFRNTPAN